MAKTQTSPTASLTLTRTFAAPREKVYRAWTDPAALAKWFAPSADYRAVVPEFDFKVGGRYRLEMHHKGGNVHRLTGIYRDIAPPEKLVFTWRWENYPDADDSVVTIEFRDLGKSTEIALSHDQLPSVEEREKHSHGWTGCLDSLATYVTQL